MNREKLQKIWKECTTENRCQVRECFHPPRQNKNQEKDNLQIYHMLFLNLCLIHDINKHWICHVSPISCYQKHWTCHENWVFCVFQKTAYKSRSEKWLPPGCNLLPHKDQGKGIAGGGLVAWHMPGCERSIWGGLCIQLCFAPNCGGRLPRDPEQKQSKNPKPLR